MTGRDDAIDALADTLDALDDHLRHSTATFRRNERLRLNMLHLHALFAMAIGPLFAAVGADGMRAPSWVIIRHIPGAPFSLGVLLFAGGLTLAVATARRNLTWEIVGLRILTGWYAILALSFAAAVFVWLAHGAPGGLAKPAPYAPLVYGHFVAIMTVHVRTLLRMRRHLRARGIT